MATPAPITKQELARADDRVLSPREVAELLGVSVFILLRKRQRHDGGDLPWVQLSENRIGYRFGDLKAFLAARRQGSLDAA
jgi:hypothetical protein